MKRSWMGFALLVVLLLGSVLVTRQMDRIHRPIEGQLQQAAGKALEGNWEEARDLFLDAEKSWKTWEHFRSCFADHNPVEEIDGDFQMLQVMGLGGDRLAFAGGCRELARKVAAVGEAHELVWWNLL